MLVIYILVMAELVSFAVGAKSRHKNAAEIILISWIVIWIAATVVFTIAAVSNPDWLHVWAFAIAGLNIGLAYLAYSCKIA